MTYCPLVIIGAGRSGTNMLRDLLCSVPTISTWPCDEINYIWRHGNVRMPTDELKVEHARPAVRRYIRTQFDKMAHKSSAACLIEKTCANSLRVDFVDYVLPEAKYIFIVRNGIDVVASAMKRWQAELNIPYVLKKARYVPTSDLPYYASKYLGNRLYRLLSGKKRLAYWGPKFEGFADYLPDHTLEEICAIQWQACVERAEKSFAKIDADRIYRIRYEDFVNEPAQHLDQMLSFAGVNATHKSIDISRVSNGSVGRGAPQLGAPKSAELTQLVKPTLEKFGYG